MRRRREQFGDIVGAMSGNNSHWARQLREAWGISAELHSLAGELDLNFHVVASDGRQFVLKVMRAGCNEAFVEMLCKAHVHIRECDSSVPVPEVIPTSSGTLWCSKSDTQGEYRLLWLLSKLDGDCYAGYRPQSLPLLNELGVRLAQLDRALDDFTHPQLSRELKWDLRTADWIVDHLGEIADPSRRAIIEQVMARYSGLLPALLREPLATIHNDVNDYNILVSAGPDGLPRISGLIDLGDMTPGPIVAELAIAAAYAALDHPCPERAIATLVAGYHSVTPLSGSQVDMLWPLIQTRLAVSVVNSALVAKDRPDDPYVVVSQAPAWRYLERARGIPDSLVAARLRSACGLPVSDAAGRILYWLDESRGSFAPIVQTDLTTAHVASLAMADSATPQNAFRLTDDEAAALGPDVAASGAWIGRYGEPRGVYTDAAFREGEYKGGARRTVHLGVDIFMAAGTAVHSPLDAAVEVVEYRDEHLDYGGMVVLRHETPEGDRFWTLYGHLSRSTAELIKPGQRIATGASFAVIGAQSENGGWQPHLHLQLVLATDALAGQWPGAADPDDVALWRSICPNPAALLNLPDERVAYKAFNCDAIGKKRRSHFVSNLRLSYAEPCLFVRGWRTHLFDEWGRPYLDAYNNVPHVGHAHPRLRAVAADQMARLNTNTRYLHPSQIEFAEELLAKVPKHLTHVFLVNSGSEGNELALRLARAHTGGKDMVVADHGYHGNTTGAIDLSAYKFNKPGGGGAPNWVHVVPVADTYRGCHRGDDSVERYAGDIDDAIARIRAGNGRLAGFIAETFPSVGGQIIPPDGYLRAVYDRIRSSGGVCIADEVQTGLGRLGAYYWGFEQQQALPDIVVLGKPLGNGHPIGAVLTTAAIAHSFDNGIEFFSTFGGSTLSCRIGTEVLRIVDEERLQANAEAMGTRLLAGLRQLQTRHEIIGDVRGSGLFIGVDLVTDLAERTPATRAADYVKNRLRQKRVLIGTEGPADNVLKIRPPLTIDEGDIDHLLEALDAVFSETAVRNSTR
jgi:4-aminobutyrate aminotransferase-like enzyme/Ser/Thr protein kinase RdoA (MazF antagonist)